MRKVSLLAGLVAASTLDANWARAGGDDWVYLREDFNTFPPAGWIINNQSDPLGGTSWFQGNPTVFPAQLGASNSYVGANFNNTGNVGTISDWLISPQFDLHAGVAIRFWTRTVTSPAFPDRLELRLSPTGGSDPGVGASSTGDFSVLLLTVNPNLTPSGYPGQWTEFVAYSNQTMLNARLAFRYFVSNGGFAGANSDYIGVDTVFVGLIPEPGSVGMLALAGFHLTRRRARVRQA